jgi:hypothetical protein
MYRTELVAALAVILLWLPPAPAAAQTLAHPAAPLSDAAMEDFLRNAKIGRVRTAGKGVTDSTRATLTHDGVTHDAHIQTVDQSLREFRSARTNEFNFRDKWQFNVAAYKLDRLLDLHLVPVTVERRWKGDPASFTWWVDDVLMDEGERIKKKVTPPDTRCWDEQMQLLRVFDQLIENTDRNLGNVVIEKTWRLWLIDHTRAFRQSKAPPSPENLTRVDRRLLERLTALQFATLKNEVKRYLDDADIRALLSRRDAIVARFKAMGERVLFDRRDHSAKCGAPPGLH